MTDDELAFIASGGVRQMNLWDSFSFYGDVPLQSWQRMFGNQNVGRMEYCNIQVPGTLCFDGVFILRRWYARTNITEPEILPAFRTWSESAYATFEMGHHNLWCLPFSELLARRPTAEASEISPRRVHDPWPITIQERQNVGVRIDTFSGAQDALISFYEYQRPIPTRRVWLHLEGVWLLNDGSRAHRSMWSRLLKAIMDLEDNARSIEDEIAAWIRGQRVDGNDDANAQLEAIADAVAESRARR